jgi:alkylated DNA repair dioxygenase AlkB
METLFPITSNYPEGFTYIPDFISPIEEQSLIQEVLKVDLHTFTFQGFEAKRKVMSFGLDYHFDSRSVSKGVPIPLFFQPLIQKLADYCSIKKEDFEEVLVTEYPEGSVINWHRDAPPFELIAGISLLSDCKFKLRPHDKEKQTRNSIITIPVKRRSLYLMQGPARNEWQHSIAPVKEKRYSITLRTMRKGM